jgi:hypothetical protein
MTFDEIDARYRAAVLTAEGDGEGWDDPETTDADDADDELGYRNVDEQEAGDETPGEEEGA